MHPILFKFGPITIYSYGAIVACAFLIATYLGIRELKFRRGVLQYAPTELKVNEALDLMLFALIFGLIGARLLHVFLNLEYYAKVPLEILFIHKGGLAFYGGIASAIAASCWYLMRRNLPIWKVGDFIFPYVALGHSIGRIGCFMNGCCYGKPTEFILRVTFLQDIITRHPTQLYSAFFLFLIFLILRFLYKRRHFDGQIFSLYLIFYSSFRFSIDFLRGDLQPVFHGLTASQLISIAVFIVGLTILLLRRPSKGACSQPA